MARKSRQSLYSQHPGFKMVEAYAVKLHERTGKTLAQWADLLRGGAGDGEGTARMAENEARANDELRSDGGRLRRRQELASGTV